MGRVGCIQGLKGEGDTTVSIAAKIMLRKKEDLAELSNTEINN